MVLISAGTYRYGDKEERYQGEFFLDRTEVTVGEYQKCVEQGRCQAPPRKGYCNNARPGREKHPQNCVTWLQARAYCRWRGKRLPREEEWERAARGKKGAAYPWGQAPPSCGLTIYQGKGSKAGCDRDGTWPVGSKPRGASPEGVLNLAGNVAEWTASCYQRGQPQTKRRATPQGREAARAKGERSTRARGREAARARGERGARTQGREAARDKGGGKKGRSKGIRCLKRVIRGGSWQSAGAFLEAKMRRGEPPTTRGPLLGFRCAMDLPAPSTRRPQWPALPRSLLRLTLKQSQPSQGKARAGNFVQVSLSAPRRGIYAALLSFDGRGQQRIIFPGRDLHGLSLPPAKEGRPGTQLWLEVRFRLAKGGGSRRWLVAVGSTNKKKVERWVSRWRRGGTFSSWLRWYRETLRPPVPRGLALGSLWLSVESESGRCPPQGGRVELSLRRPTRARGTASCRRLFGRGGCIPEVPVVQAGDELEFGLRVNRPLYVLLLNRTEKGIVVPIWPPRGPLPRLRPEKLYRPGSRQDRYLLRAKGQGGFEQVFALASPRKKLLETLRQKLKKSPSKDWRSLLTRQRGKKQQCLPLSVDSLTFLLLPR